MTQRTLILLLTCSSVLLAGCQPQAPADAAPAPVVQPVKLFQVPAQQSAQYRDFPATVEAAQVAQLSFRVAGELAEFPVKAGDDVVRGALVAKLDPRDYQLVVDQAQARFDLAQAQFARTENLVDQGVISPQQFDEVKANLDIARANLDTAKSNLSYTELRAPFAGTIAHLFVERFETVQPQQPIVTLQMNDAIDVSINVPENLFARVRRNSDYRPDVIFASAPDTRYSATLKEWDAVADPATNTYKVVFTLPSPTDLNVLPGMTARVRVDINAVSEQASSAQIIPASAVFTPRTVATDSAPKVWVYDPQSQQVSMRSITVAAVTERGIEVATGLNPGEQIVVAGVHALTDGQQVRPWQKEPGL